jgi:cytochrome subunit of sulfide dehydrogenase
MKPTVVHLACVWAALAAAAAGPAHAQPQAADAVARSYAATCANCHGTNGNAKPPMVSLAGLPKEHIVTQMKAFKGGTRPATIMGQIAKGYTDEQIDSIAGFFAAQKR